MATAGLPPLRPLRVVAWLGGLVAAIALLGALGEGSLAAPPLDPATWAAWATQRDPAMVVVSLLRLVTLLLAWYLLGATVINVLARLLSSTRLVAVADLLTLPSVRRVLQGALGVGFAAAAALGSAATAPTPTPVATHPVTALVTSDAAEMVPLGQEEAVMLPVPTPAAQQDQEQSARIWTVKPGEHFWSIAEQVLTQAWGRSPTDAETAPYWERLVEANRDRLADRENADFIRPGERFSVPPPPQDRG